MRAVTPIYRQPFALLQLGLCLALLVGCAASPTQQSQDRKAESEQAPTSAPPVPDYSEVVLDTGEQVVANTPAGKIVITAGPGLRRTFSWDGATRSVVMQPRKERFAGSKGIYYEATSGHWKPHNGIDRAKLEEGQRNFDNLSDAKIWMQIRRLHYVHNSNGLVIGWRRLMDENTLQVELWQFQINGEKPAYMPGAKDYLISRQQTPLRTTSNN